IALGEVEVAFPRLGAQRLHAHPCKVGGAEVADDVEAALQQHHPKATRIGRVDVDGSRVLLETGVGGRRVLDLLAGGQLPRIC
ncbi:MAG: hydrogenase expression/formation protein HypE, partial [Armatimonadetes bacterium]|nr:hydrogenase expression/formation protein HypE [Armatimonadota bacterium]